MSLLFWIVCALLAIGAAAMIGLQSVPISENRRRLGQQLTLWPSNTRITFTGDVAASTTLSTVSSFAGLQIGMTLSGLGITAGQTIVAMDSAAGTITLSAAGGGVHAGATITASWVATTAQVHLFAAPYTGGADPDPTVFTEATFDTYAPLSMPVPAGPYTNPDGSAEADYGDLSWVLLATPTVGNTIYGYWVDYIYPAGGADRVVAVWETFPTPIKMSAVGQAVVMSVPMTVPDPGSVTLP